MQRDAQQADFVRLREQLHSADAAELDQRRDHVELVVDDLTHPILGSHQQRDQHFPVLKLEGEGRKEISVAVILIGCNFHRLANGSTNLHEAFSPYHHCGCVRPSPIRNELSQLSEVGQTSLIGRYYL